MLHKNGKPISGCQHNRGLINQYCTQCGKFVDFRKFKKVKKVVDEREDSQLQDEIDRLKFEKDKDEEL